MSIKSWKAKYLPGELKDAIGSPLEAAEHSLRCWEGRLPGVLKKHGLMKQAGSDYIRTIKTRKTESGSDVFDFVCLDGEACALCAFAETELKEWNILPSGVMPCSSCPFYKLRGEVPCSIEKDDEKCSPWREWADHGDPGPMLAWLHTLVAELKKEKK